MCINCFSDFDITCFSWAKMYVELLHSFGIVSRVRYVEDNFFGRKTSSIEPSTSHAYVEIIMNGRVYISDLTASYKDMVAIKLGLDTYYNSQLSKRLDEKDYHFSRVSENVDRYRKSIKESLRTLKEKLQDMKEDLNSEEFILKVYKLIGYIMQISEFNANYVVGAKSINFLLGYFIGEDYKALNRYFIDKDKSVFIKVYKVYTKGIVHYFAYSKSSNGIYEFQEITREQIELYSRKYPSTLTEILNSEKHKDDGWSK